MLKYLLLSLGLLSLRIVKADDLSPADLKLKVMASQQVFSPNQIVPLLLQIKNVSQKTATLILPGREQTGLAIIYLSYYKQEGTFYREVYREERQLEGDSLTKGGEFVRNLESGDSLRFPIFLNDARNASTQTVARHFLPPLEEGEYKLLVWYNPLDRPLAPFFYNRISPLGDQRVDGNLISIEEGGIMSDYLSFTYTKKAQAPILLPSEKSSLCSGKCHLCKAIDRQHWKSLEHIFSGQAKNKHINSKTPRRNEGHRSIAWIYPPPEAILASLPTYTSQQLILYSEGQYYYLTLGWQLGRIYRFNGYVKMGIDAVFNSDIGIPTSNVEYVKLNYFNISPDKVRLNK